MFDGAEAETEPDEDSGALEPPGPSDRARATRRPSARRCSCCKRTYREFGDDGSTDQAAALTYYSVLALFPGLIALLSLVGLFGQAQESVDKILEILQPLVSSDRPDSDIDRGPQRARLRPGRRHRAGHRCAWVRCGRRRATSARSAGR